MLELEKSKSENTTFACISDQSYLKYLRVFLRSLIYSNNHHHVYICLINIQNKKRESVKLQRLYKHITITFLDIGELKKHEKKAFCANHRAELICFLLDQNFDLIIYIDVDSLVRKQLIFTPSTMGNSDIKIFFREEEDIRFKVATGVIFIKNTPQVKLFLVAWRNALALNKKKWFSDQISFSETYEEFKNQVAFGHLESNMIDWNFLDSSDIWAGKGDRKKSNIIYLLETIKITIDLKFANKAISKLQSKWRMLHQLK